MGFQDIVDVAAIGAVINCDLLVGVVELLDCSLKRACGDHWIGGDELDRRAPARGNSLEVLTGSRSRDCCRGARHIRQQRPVSRRGLRVIGRIPGNSRLGGDVDAVGGRAVSALGLHRRLNAVARNQMGQVAVNLRKRGHAKQAVLPRRRNAIGRNPLNRVVESVCSELDALSDERIVERQRAGLGVNAFGEFRPVRITLALGIPCERELSVLGQIGIGPARGAGNFHARGEHRANGESRRRRLIGGNGFELVLPGKRHGANGIDGLRAAVGALLLGALHRVLARDDHTNVLAHHIGRGRVRCGIGRVGNVDEVAVVGALVVGVLPLIVDRVRRGDVSVGVALGRLRGQNLACRDLSGCQSAHDRHAVEIDRSSLHDGQGARLLVTEAAVGACLDVFVRQRRVGRERVGVRPLDLRVASARRVPAVPRPGNLGARGHVIGARLRGGGDLLADFRLDGAVEGDLRDVDGARSADEARALGGVVAAADLCGYMAADRLALISRELEGVRRRALDVGVGTTLGIRDLPLIAQLRGIDVIGGALLFGEGLDGVVNGIDIGAGGGAFGGQDGGVDVHGTGLLKGTHTIAGRPAAERDLIRARVRGH